jgi:hypothetical protein
MAATFSTTGGGKSFYLDELAALRPEDLEMIFGDLEEMKKVLSTMPNGTDVVKVLPQIMQKMKEILQNTVSLHLQKHVEYKILFDANRLRSPSLTTADQTGLP